ncbi:hypothetical protein ACIF6I_35630 [Streptomyces microflavus]|uniref:hypothetical protein n=1 Tax=Streptomyces microflavus TaxID=1919 RepID=UPI0037D2F6BE
MGPSREPREGPTSVTNPEHHRGFRHHRPHHPRPASRHTDSKKKNKDNKPKPVPHHLRRPAPGGSRTTNTCPGTVPLTGQHLLDSAVAEAPYAEAPYAEAAVAEAPYAEAPYAEAPYAEAAVAEAPYAEAAVAEAPYAEAAVAEDPYAEDPYESGRHPGVGAALVSVEPLAQVSPLRW